MMKMNSLISIVVSVASLALSLPAMADFKADEIKKSPQEKQPWQQDSLKSLPPDVVMDAHATKSVNMEKIPGTNEPWTNTLLRLHK
jgi:hypothetical protein